MSIDQVADLGPDYELQTNSQDLEAWADTLGYDCWLEYAGCIFVSFDDPKGGIEGYRVFVCEDSVPHNSDPVWEIYPKQDYC